VLLGGDGVKVYYNEIDPKKCAMLSQLMRDGHIRKGDIDDRSIRDVQPADVKGYERAHFFAGVGLWDYALDLAGWKQDTPVWTGSCPCQPFSSAGRQKAQADDRHLWPEWERLIRECGPATVFGEQVASAIAKGWLDDVYEGLEAEGYACGSAVLPACSVGAAHRRERLWFVAHSESSDFTRVRSKPDRKPCGFADNGALGNADSAGPQRRATMQQCADQRPSWQTGLAEWSLCADGKERLIEPGIPLLAHGDTERVGLIHAAGDAIVPQVAAEFIGAFQDVMTEQGGTC